EGQEAGSRKKILSNSLCIPRGEGDPFVRLRGGEKGSAVFAKPDIAEEFVGFTTIDAEGGLLRQIHLKSNGCLPILENVVVIPVHDFAGRRAEIDNLAVLRSPEIGSECVVLPNVDAIHESQLGAEIRREIVVTGGKTEMPAAVRCVGPQRVAVLRTPGWITRPKGQAILSGVEILPRPAVHPLNIDHPVLREFQPRIQRSHAVAG